MCFPSILSLLAHFPVLPGAGTKLKFLQIVWLDTDPYAIEDSLLWSNEIELIPNITIIQSKQQDFWRARLLLIIILEDDLHAKWTASILEALNLCLC